MSLAAETRDAVAAHPFLVTALRAGIVNYTAAARFLDVDGETDAIATALRRYAGELPEYETDARNVRVTMESGVGLVERDGNEDADGGADADAALTEDALLSVAGTHVGPIDGGEYTAIVATGAVDATALAAVLRALALDDVSPRAAAVGDEAMVVVVERLEGANALRTVEETVGRVPR